VPNPTQNAESRPRKKAIAIMAFRAVE